MTDTPPGDVAQLVRDKHVELKRLFRQAAYGHWGERRAAFKSLVRLLALHEATEEEIVYSGLRSEPDGDDIADSRVAELREAKRMLADLERDGINGNGFAARLTMLRDAVLRHASREEQTVLPIPDPSRNPRAVRGDSSRVEVATSDDSRGTRAGTAATLQHGER